MPLIQLFAPDEARYRLRALPRILLQNVYAQVILAFLVILLLKWDTLTQAPVWDTAMGVFPAALTLAGNGFDLIALLQMPKFLQGGPNVHSTSWVTLLTAVVLMLTGGGLKSFVALHLLHFGIAAAALVTLFQLARPVLGRVATLLLCLSVLLYPVFSVQVGYMYLEVPLFLCGVAALLAWVRGRFWWAVLWSTLAVATKEAGIIVPATLALATLLESRSLTARLRRVAQIAGPPAVWLGTIKLVSMLGAETFEVLPSLQGMFGGFVDNLGHFLLNVPDLLIFIIVFLIASLLSVKQLTKTLRLEPPDLGARDPESQARLVLGLSGIMILCFLLLFTIALPIGVHFTLILPRYYVVILPFLLLWTGYTAQRLLGGRFKSPASGCFILLSIFFSLNTDGRYYPLDTETYSGPATNNFPLTERSNAYRRLNAVQREAMQYLETLPEDAHVFYGFYEHYLFSYPELGYTSGPLRNGHSVPFDTTGPDGSLKPGIFPDCLYVLYSHPWLAADYMWGYVQFVDSREDLSRETVREFRDGRYKISLIRVRRAGAACPAMAGG